MTREFLTGIGLALGLAALSGSLSAPAAAAPSPPAIAATPACPPAVQSHHVTHGHWVRPRYAVRTTYARVSIPGCGSIDHPCNVEHLTAPIQ